MGGGCPVKRLGHFIFLLLRYLINPILVLASEREGATFLLPVSQVRRTRPGSEAPIYLVATSMSIFNTLGFLFIIYFVLLDANQRQSSETLGAPAQAGSTLPGAGNRWLKVGILSQRKNKRPRLARFGLSCSPIVCPPLACRGLAAINRTHFTFPLTSANTQGCELDPRSGYRQG